jgi:hypothetical protein
VHAGFWWEDLREGTIWINRHRWEDNIKMDIQEVGWGMDWIQLAQYRDRLRALVNAIINLRVP